MEGEGRKRKGERDTHCSRREARKKLENNGLHDNNWNIQCLFRKDSAGLNSADGCTDSYCTHIYRSKTHTFTFTYPPLPDLFLSHSAMHFIYGTVFLWGIHLSKLFSSHSCHISLSVPSWSFSTLSCSQRLVFVE